MTFLTRIDPTRNIDRFYVVQVLPTLFGDWTVLREWGRRGSPGTMRLESYQRRNEAETAEQRTISAGCSTAIGKGTPLPDDGSLARDDQLYHRCGVLPVEHDIEESASHRLSLQNGGQWPI